MRKKPMVNKLTKRIGFFARVVFALAAGGAFAYLAWEPTGGQRGFSVKSGALSDGYRREGMKMELAD